MLRWLALLPPTLLSTTLSLAAQADVTIVDPGGGPGSDYTDLQDAVDAACDGDLLLVRSGTHSARIDGKSLVLQAETPLGARFELLRVWNLAADQFVSLQGFRGELLDLRNCAGPVLIHGGDYFGIQARDCADLVLSDLEIDPLVGTGPVCDGGLAAWDSSVHAYDCVILGEESIVDLSLGFCFPSPGIFLSDSALALLGSTVDGGNENFLYEFCASPGLRAVGDSSLVMTDSVIEAGRAVFFPLPDCGTIPDVEGVVPTHRGGTLRRLGTSSPVVEGATTTIEVQGEPGDLVFLTMSLEPASTRPFPNAGSFHGNLGRTLVFPFGFVPPGGVLSRDVAVPAFPGGDLYVSAYLQTLTLSTGFELRLGSPSQVHVLDPMAVPVAATPAARATTGPRLAGDVPDRALREPCIPWPLPPPPPASTRSPTGSTASARRSPPRRCPAASRSTSS